MTSATRGLRLVFPRESGGSWVSLGTGQQRGLALCLRQQQGYLGSIMGFVLKPSVCISLVTRQRNAEVWRCCVPARSSLRLATRCIYWLREQMQQNKGGLAKIVVMKIIIMMMICSIIHFYDCEES